jgi:glycosyltransferase involved in cell wall biosynthesis/SAM-dependent methyltransferase
MDVVADAYLGNINSQQLVNDTRERIDWLQDIVGSGKILDIGCSQGILAVLLARRGNTSVTGIDILNEAIVDARNRLALEPSEVQNAVEFHCLDFLEEDISSLKGKFDTVVIGQVLEHVGDPTDFVRRAIQCLNDTGMIIVTVPYGVWDHDEHEHTFYVHDLFEIMSPSIEVVKIALVGGRLAMVGQKQAKAPLSLADLPKLERDFFIRKERRILERNSRLKKQVESYSRARKKSVSVQQSAQISDNPEHADQARFFKGLSKITRELSKERFAQEKLRAEAAPLRRVLHPLHWFRKELGLRLASQYKRQSLSPSSQSAAIEAFLGGPKQALFHRRDVSRFYEQSLNLLLSCFGAEVVSKVVDSAQEFSNGDPKRALVLFYLLQANKDFDKALKVCRELVNGSYGTLSKTDLRKLHREPVARLLAMDLLPEPKDVPVFDPSLPVAYVVHSSLPYVSVGYATRTQGFAEGLQKNLPNLTVITRPGFPLNVLKGKSASEIPLTDNVEGVTYHRVLEPVESSVLPFEYIQSAADRLEQEFISKGVGSVIAASNYTCALPAIIAARRLGLPCVYEVRGFWEISKKAKVEGYAESADFAATVEIEAFTARAADKVITLTEGMRSELVNRGVAPARISLAPNGFRENMTDSDTNSRDLKSELGIPVGCPVIGYIGSIVEYEGLDDLAMACVGLHARGVDFRLLIVGDEKNREAKENDITSQVIRIFADAGISEKLIMTGRVKHQEVPGYYRIVDIAPVPRKAIEVSELVSPIKPLEAMAFGTALVVSSVGALTEFVKDGHNGYVFRKGSVADLRDTLSDAIEDEVKRNSIAMEGQRFALEERTWSMIAKRTVETIFQSAIGR